MPNNKFKGTNQNDDPRHTKSGSNALKDGYSRLDQRDVTDRFTQERRGLTRPQRGEHGHLFYDY